MGQPNRHGHGGWSQVPVPVGVGAGAAQGAGARSAGGGPAFTPAPGPTNVARVLTTRSLNTFLEALPNENVSHLALHTTQPYDPTTTVGTKRSLQANTVPNGNAWVITDLRFFALAPSVGLMAPPAYLAAENLAGLIRFDIEFASRSPLKLEGTFYSVYGGAAAAALQVGSRSGWPFMRQDFGTQRELSFALYAKEGDRIDAIANVDIAPQFPLAALGVEIHGFVVPSSLLSKIWGGAG